MEIFENKPEILMLENDDYEDFTKTLKILTDGQIELPADEIIDDSIALAITLKGKHTIVVNKTVYDSIDEDYKDIVIMHELAHCEGIRGEEDADRWVVEILEECDVDRSEAVEKLKDMWEHKHGHEYREVE